MRLRLKLAAGLLGFLALIPVCLAYGLYFWGLSLAPRLPGPPAADGVTPLLRDTIWADVENSAPVEVETVTPVGFLIRLVSLQFVPADGPVQLGPGLRIASRCANDVVYEDLSRPVPTFERHVTSTAVAIWLTSNWSTDEIIACAMQSAYFGHGLRGFEAAAKGYFGRASSEMSLAEAAMLVSVWRAPSRFDPACNPELVLVGRNRLLARMARLGLITGAQEAEGKAGTLGVILTDDCD